MDVCPLTFGTTHTLELELFPKLLLAVWNDLDLAVRLHFSVPMTPDEVPGTKLFLRFANFERPLYPGIWEAEDICRFEEIDEFEDAGADIVSYIDPVMNFRSITGHYLPFFTDFPLTT